MDLSYSSSSQENLSEETQSFDTARTTQSENESEDEEINFDDEPATPPSDVQQLIPSPPPSRVRFVDNPPGNNQRETTLAEKFLLKMDILEQIMQLERQIITVNQRAINRQNGTQAGSIWIRYPRSLFLWSKEVVFETFQLNLMILKSPLTICYVIKNKFNGYRKY